MQLVSGASSHLKLPRSGVLCVAAGEEGPDGCLAPDGGEWGRAGWVTITVRIPELCRGGVGVGSHDAEL